MASLDLSMAFDLVNTELLVKRLKIMGLPNDLKNLIREWLKDRSFYVEVGNDCSALYDLNNPREVTLVRKCYNEYAQLRTINFQLFPICQPFYCHF